MSEKVFNTVEIQGMKLQFSPVEAHRAIENGEGYHASLLHIFLVIRKSYPKLKEHIVLRLALSSTNDTMGPEGLGPFY